MENILEFIIRGVGMIIAVAAITFFISSQALIMGVLDRENTSDFYQIDNATQQYEDYILGHELISQIYNDDKGIHFSVYNSSGILVITLVDCAELSQLVGVNPTSIYDISKAYAGNLITQITYKER